MTDADSGTTDCREIWFDFVTRVCDVDQMPTRGYGRVRYILKRSNVESSGISPMSLID